MKKTTFNAIRQLVYSASGISLADSKEALVQSRIANRTRELDLDVEGYLALLGRDEREVDVLIDAISTNVTSFFRENAHYPLFQALIEQRVKSGAPRIRVWSAGCSTGEEPYSLVMSALQVPGTAKVDFKLLGTDICRPALQKAMEGVYEKRLLEKVPKGTLERFFKPLADGRWQARDELRSRVMFRYLNLNEPIPLRGPLDAVFCRNVMIYFEQPMRRRLVQSFLDALAPDGLLFIGHSESLTGLDVGVRAVGPSAYQKLERVEVKGAA
ncbi:MAG: protein-glutamate O-methyltransferase CheR [Myxococcales bacterium]|nr:protein-glutamate O-methyltransferase CheR [Myxococcales bacterium]